jgi:hypothetical protein
MGVGPIRLRIDGYLIRVWKIRAPPFWNRGTIDLSMVHSKEKKKSWVPQLKRKLKGPQASMATLKVTKSLNKTINSMETCLA